MNFNLFKMIQSLLDHSNTNYLGFNFFLCNCLVHTDYDNFKLFFVKVDISISQNMKAYPTYHLIFFTNPK